MRTCQWIAMQRITLAYLSKPLSPALENAARAEEVQQYTKPTNGGNSLC